MTEEQDPVDLATIVKHLEPYVQGLVDTIGLAGQAHEKDGKKLPGDVKAASVGLELVSKYLSGRGATGVNQLLKALREARSTETSEDAVSSPTAGKDGSNQSDEG